VSSPAAKRLFRVRGADYRGRRAGTRAPMDNGPVATREARRAAVSPEGIFVSLRAQLDNIREWNEERQWGFSPDELDSVDLAPASGDEPLVVDLIAVYLDDTTELNGVRRTCHELWTLAAEQQPHSWCWDWYWDKWMHRPKPVRLRGHRASAWSSQGHRRPRRSLRTRTECFGQQGSRPRLSARRGARRCGSLPPVGPGHGRTNRPLHLALRL
jgi:hypothetical protein